MKAIYLNLDAAVRAVCAGRKVVQSMLPLAVTIPAGASAAVFAQTGTAAETADAGSAVTGITWTFSPSLSAAIASGVAPGMSQVLASESASVYAVTGGSFVATAAIKNSDTTLATVALTVIVNREQAQGPVDLVDWQPTSEQFISDQSGFESALRAADFSGVALVGASASGLSLAAADSSGLSLAAADASGLSLAAAVVDGLDIAGAKYNEYPLATCDAEDVCGTTYTALGLGELS